MVDKKIIKNPLMRILTHILWENYLDIKEWVKPHRERYKNKKELQAYLMKNKYWKGNEITQLKGYIIAPELFKIEKLTKGDFRFRSIEDIVENYKFGVISSLLTIENLQSSQIPSGLSVSFTTQILQIIFFTSNQ